VAALGDIACSVDDPDYNGGEGLVDACQTKLVGEALERENLDAVLLLGDAQYPTGAFEDFEKSFLPYFREINAPMYITPGNHDYGLGSLAGYSKGFDQYLPNVTYEKEGKSYYDFNLGSWQLYALDSNCQYVGGCGYGTDQHNWLTSKVNKSTVVCSIAFWHDPLFSSSARNTGANNADLQPFWSTLSAGHTDIILNANDHHYERLAPKLADGTVSTDGIRQFIVGTGGYGLRRATGPAPSGREKLIDNQFGYLYLELYPGRYEWQYKTVDGAILDKGGDSCRTSSSS
jgi:hypothetical protein